MAIKHFTHSVFFPLTLVFFVFVFLIFMIGSGLTSKRVGFLTRGAGVESVDPTTSLIFVNPLSISTPTSPVKITVQLRSKNSSAVTGVDVSVKAIEGLIAPVQGSSLTSTTNDKGIAEFTVVLPDLKPSKIQALFGPSQTPVSNTVLIQVISL